MRWYTCLAVQCPVISPPYTLTKFSCQMKNEATAFEQFRSTLENEHESKKIAGITKEIQWMSEAKLVLDELNIMKFLFDTQKKEFRYLCDVLQQVDSGSAQPSYPPETKAIEQNHSTSAVPHGIDLQTGIRFVTDLEGNSSAGAEAPEDSPEDDGNQASEDAQDDYATHLRETTTHYHRSNSREGQRDTRLGAIWTQRRNGLLLNDVLRSIEDVKGMMDGANRAYKSVGAPTILRINWIMTLNIWH